MKTNEKEKNLNFQENNSLKNYYNPYQRSINKSKNNHLNSNLLQVELGIVDGSSLNPIKNQSNQIQNSNQTQNQNQKSTGLLTKCVDWLFKNPSHLKSKKNSSNQTSNSISNQSEPAAKSNSRNSFNPLNQITQIDFNRKDSIQIDSSNSNSKINDNFNPNQSNPPDFLSLPNQNKSRSIDQLLRSQSPFVPYNPPILNSSSSSSSLQSINNITSFPYSSSQQQETYHRRPSTSHATLNLPISSTDPKSIFNPHFHHPTNSNHLPDSSLRSPSPLFRRTTLSPSNHIVQSSSLSHLGRHGSSRRALNSTLGLPSPHPRASTQIIHPTSVDRKREYDKISVSPVRLNQSPQSRSQTHSVFPNESQTSKRQMFWDPDLGFATREQRDKILRENEIKIRNEQGRPFPTNEAEKILQVLEIGRNPHPFLKTNRQLPSISVPTPSALKKNSVKNLNRSNGFSTDLDALYEEQASHSNPVIIAPISKKLNAERMKRLADKKGQLRAEIKKLKMFEENLKRQSLQISNHPSEPNGSTPHDQLTVDSQPSTQRAMRSASADTPPEPESPPRRRSTRKIGKLTSDSIKAKVNQGRKSRSRSVNEEETQQDPFSALSSSKLKKSSTKRSSAPNGSIDPSKGFTSNLSESTRAASKAFKSRKSPSPIQEEDEELGNQSAHLKPQIPLQQHTSCLHPTVRSSSISLQAPTSIVKSSSISSLRPGRTFSSRRHAKAKVFSALEEDLPPLNEGDDEEADRANEKLKKIKLPSTFLSSFKLDKFTPPPSTPQVNVQTALETQETRDSNPASNQDSPKKSISYSGQTSLSSSSVTPNTTTSLPVVSSAATLTPGQPVTSASFPSSSQGENQIPSTNPPGSSSTFFSQSKAEPVQSGHQPSSSQAPITSFGGFPKIPIDKPPPNFFSGPTTSTPIAAQPTNSDTSNLQAQQNRSDQQTENDLSSSLFSFQPAKPPGAIATGTTTNAGSFKFNSESIKSSPSLPTSSSVDTPNVVAESTEAGQNKTPLFAFGTQTSSQSTTKVNDPGFLTPTPTSSDVTSTNDSTKASNSQPQPTAPTFSFGGVSNPSSTSIFGSQPEPTKVGSDQGKVDSVPVAKSATTTPFLSSTFAFGGSQTSSSTAHEMTNTQSDSSQSGMFGTMSSTPQPPSSIFGKPSTSIPTSQPATTSVSNTFSFNIPTKSTTDTPFGGSSLSSSQQTPSPFAFGTSTPSTSQLTVPAQSAPSAGLFGASNPASGTGGGVSSAPAISFAFGNTSSSSNTSSTPFIFGANNTSSLTSTPTPSFGQPSSNNNGSTTNVFNFGAVDSTPAPTGAQNQIQASNGMFGLSSGHDNPQNTVNGATPSSTNQSSFNFGVTSQGFNNNNNSSLFGNSNGGSAPPAINLFGNNQNLNGSTVTNNKPGLFGGSLFGSSSTAVATNDNNDSNHNMMETNSIPNSMFAGGGGMNNVGSLGGFGNGNSSNSMTTTTINSNPFSPFGGSNLNLATTQNTPQAINFGIGATPSSSTTAINGTIVGNSDLNSGIVNHPPTTPASGGFVFNIGSGSASGRTIKKLPGSRKIKR